MKFIKPIKYGKLIDQSSKKYTYKLDSFDRVLSPYDGVIYDINQNKCDGFIKVLHSVNNETFFSEFCGVPQIDIIFGAKVKQGEPIGSGHNNEVKFTIKDKNNESINLDLFLQRDFDISKKEKEISKKEKEITKKEKEKNKEYKGGKRDWNDWMDYKSEGPDIFTSLMLTPFDFINKALKDKPKEERDDITEEISRIKDLLK